MKTVMIFVSFVLAIAIMVWPDQALAVKKVPKSGDDTAAVKNPQPKDQSKSVKPIQQPPQPPVSTGDQGNIYKDKFIDLDGDGINDNIQKAKTPEVKKEKVVSPKAEPVPEKKLPPEEQKPKKEERQPKSEKR